MQGDPLRSLSEVESRLKAVVAKTNRLQARRDQVASDLRETESEIADLSLRIEKLTKVGELFRSLMDLMVNRQVRSIEGVVSQGLKTIFHDQDLSFDAEVGTKYNKIAVDFFIRREDGGRVIRGEPLESFGGGPTSVASLALRVLAIFRLKLWPMLLLDESLAAVAEVYVDATGQFLAGLAQRMKMDILLVTHTQSFLDHANCAYMATEQDDKEGGVRLALKRIR